MPSDARTGASRRMLTKLFSIACMSTACMCAEAKEVDERVIRMAGGGEAAPAATVRDPAVANLLDALAVRDADDRGLAEVWIAFCGG